MNEHGLKRKVDAYLKALRQKGAPLWYMKTWGSAYAETGIPDYIGTICGKFFWIELKHPERQVMPTPKQIHCMLKLNKLGTLGLLTNDYGEFKHWIDNQIRIALESVSGRNDQTG